MLAGLQAVADGRYVLEEPIGHGGTAIVMRGQDTVLGRTVAVKILAEQLAADPAVRSRFLREARTSARLSHPNIVQVFDAGEQDGRPFLVMEHVPGPSLAEDLRARGRFPAREVVRIGRQVCAGLIQAHAAGLVHRDIKPGNLLRAPDGTVKVTDFGIALDGAQTSLTAASTVIGTMVYLAPRQADGEEAAPADDLFALGVCMYEMLTGVPPWRATNLADLAWKQRNQRPRKIYPSLDVPEALSDIVDRCLAVDPRERPASAARLAAELTRIETAPGAIAGLPATEVLERDPSGSPADTAPHDRGVAGEHTVPILREGLEPLPAWRLPPRLARLAAGLLWPALAALLAVAIAAGILASLSSGAPPDAGRGTSRDRGEVSVDHRNGAGDPATGDQDGDARSEPAPEGPEKAARDLAEWVRHHSEIPR